jgi:hypothetical protein
MRAASRKVSKTTTWPADQRRRQPMDTGSPQRALAYPVLKRTLLPFALLGYLSLLGHLLELGRMSRVPGPVHNTLVSCPGNVVSSGGRRDTTVLYILHCARQPSMRIFASTPHFMSSRSGFPFSTTYVASSAPFWLPTFLAEWIVPAGMNRTSPALRVTGGAPSI